MTDTKNSADREWMDEIDRRSRFGNRSTRQLANDARSFGELLRRKRELGLLTRKQLAEKSGLSERTIRLLEEGKSVRPSVKTVLALLDVPDLALDFKDCPAHIQPLGTLGSGDAFDRWQVTKFWYLGARSTYQDLLKFLETEPEPSPSDVRALIAKRIAKIEAQYDIQPRGDAP
jgi:transcriptional regulator with XRE-family HTH domain